MWLGGTTAWLNVVIPIEMRNTAMIPVAPHIQILS
jgi:hypothetical protein